MSSPLTDDDIVTNDVIEAVHITQLFPLIADLECPCYSKTGPLSGQMLI